MQQKVVGSEIHPGWFGFTAFRFNGECSGARGQGQQRTTRRTGEGPQEGRGGVCQPLSMGWVFFLRNSEGSLSYHPCAFCCLTWSGNASYFLSNFVFAVFSLVDDGQENFGEWETTVRECTDNNKYRAIISRFTLIMMLWLQNNMFFPANNKNNMEINWFSFFFFKEGLKGTKLSDLCLDLKEVFYFAQPISSTRE